MIQLTSDSIAATHAIAAAVAAVARAGDIIVLSGEMGAGKTAFAQGFAAARGVTEPVTSPTFTLVHSYPCGPKLTLHHADLYRLERTGEVDDLALAELADLDGLVLIEWGEIVEGSFSEFLQVDLAPTGDAVDEWGGRLARAITIQGIGRSWAQRWERLQAGLSEWSASC